jgi:DNA segregation ATPase FtsK/SpoIIIE-like protein
MSMWNAEKQELYKRCVESVVARQNASPSALQRHMRIGFGLTSEYLYRMEEEGIVSTRKSEHGRAVLVKKPMSSIEKVD